jgi:hypothetical protein
MTVENRRQHSRLIKPLEGSWRGLSGAAPCRISDIGWGGCFIQTVVTPPVDTETVVTVSSLLINDRALEITGRVRYVEAAMGFAMVFDTLTAEQINALTELLGEPPTR